MKNAVLAPAPDPGAEAKALIREARRRHRRRQLIISLAAAAVLASGLGAIAGHPGTGRAGTGRPRPASGPRVRPAAGHPARPQGPGPIPRSVGTTVLMWPVGYPDFGPAGGPPAYADNLSTRHLSQRRQPAIGAGDYQPLLIEAGRWLVYAGNGATAIRADLKGRPRVLGKTPFFAPSAAPGHVWLEYGILGHGANTVRSVPVTGGPPGPAITLPRGSRLIGGTDSGFLLSSRNGELQRWSPGGTPAALPYSPLSAGGFDASARLVAYGTGCAAHETAKSGAEPGVGYYACRVLRVLNLVNGKLHSFSPPPGTAGWVPNGFGLVSAIRPGGAMIAAYAAVRPPGGGRTRLYVLRLAGARRRVTAVPSSAAFLFARTGWSARGSWLLYQGPGRHLWAYQVTTGRVRSSATRCCQYTVMATVKSPAARGAGRDHRAGVAGSGP